jgi:hypothetical protein
MPRYGSFDDDDGVKKRRRPRKGKEPGARGPPTMWSEAAAEKEKVCDVCVLWVFDCACVWIDSAGR